VDVLDVALLAAGALERIGVGAEDAVLRKLLWYRSGGGVSDRQWRDVVQVLRISRAGLDGAYLDSWAARLDLVALLSRARTEAGMPR